MTLLTYIKNEAKSPQTNLLLFLQKYNKYDNNYHFFFEGEDDPSFYLTKLINNCNIMSSNFIYCTYGKDNALKIHSLINWSIYAKNRTLFFIDKDHEDFIQKQTSNEENIYVTELYSIENYITEPSLLRNILIEIFHINNDELITNIIDLFRLSYQSFKIKMIILNSWIIVNRLNSRKMNLNNIDLSKLYKIESNGKIKNLFKKREEYYKYLNKQANDVSIPNLQTLIIKVIFQLKKISNAKIYIRGKFELWHYVEFLKFTANYLKKNGQNPKIKTNINHSNALEILAPRVNTPEKLHLFIKKHCLCP